MEGHCRGHFQDTLRQKYIFRLLMKTVLIWLIRVYRNYISPLFPPSCRYQPTCSQYAIQAIERFGICQGSWLALKRIVRCNPFYPGGYDPIPQCHEHKQ